MGEPVGGGDGRPGTARWRGWFASTGAEPAWRTVATVIAGIVLAGVLAFPLHATDRPAAVAVAAVAGGLVAAAGMNAPPALARPVATGAAVAVVVFEVVAVAVGGRPWLAALAMGLVAVFTSVGAGVSAIGAEMGLLATLGYVLTVLLISLFPAPASVGSGFLTASGALLGAAIGLGVTAVGAAVRRRRSPPTGDAPRPPAPWAAMWQSFRDFDSHVHDGLRRALPLGLFIGVYELTGSHDVLWAFIAALVVLLPTGKSPVEVAAARVVSTVVGVAILIPLSQLLPLSVLIAGALAVTLLGTAYKPRYPLLADAATAMGAIVIVGAPTGAITDYATLRLVDTVVGTGIALASGYLLWPRDAPEDGTRPDDGAGPERVGSSEPSP